MTTLRRLRNIVTYSAMLLTSVLPAQAQPQSSKVEFPQGLEWQMMREVTFNFPPKSSGTAQEKQIAEALWAKELAARKSGTYARPDGSRYEDKDSAFVLLSAVAEAEIQYVMSMYFSLGSECEGPANGRSVTDMFAKCPMRVAQRNAAGAIVGVKNIPDFCYLNVDDSNNPLAKNHTEIAFDGRNKTAYFRVIQYGKLVPACNRSLRLM